MKKSIFMKIYIIPMIFFSPIIMMSCNSWFSIWMMIELNLMSFIPMIIFFNKFYKELAIKYFIIQAISSSLLIFSSNFILINMFNHKLIINLIINLSLLIKLGIPPFHNWFINLMNNMSWNNCLILSTWQKIIPLISLMYIFNEYMIFILIIISSLIGTIFGLNHQSIRIIMSYSSINHISWLLMNILISEMITMMYFLLYSIMNFSIMMMFNKMNLFYMNQLFSKFSNYKFKMIILMNFFSISSLPPFLGFSLKWMSIYYINYNYIQSILFIMIILSIFSFTYYMRICLNFLLSYQISNKMIIFNKFINFNTYINMIIFSSFMNLWIISMWIY